MSRFEEAFKIVIGNEGGFQNDPDDKGNWTGGNKGVGVLKGTKYGISAASYPTADIKNLTLDDAKRVYKRDYWDRIYGDFLTPALALVAFDFAVNSGYQKSREFLKLTHGPQEFMERRADYVEELLKNPKFQKYANGWRNRIQHMKELAAQWQTLYPEPAVRFTYPVLPYKEYVVWDGGSFLDPLYLKYEGYQHPGTDYNSRLGGDKDLGDRVYAAAKGVVSDVRTNPTIGNMVEVKHAENLYSIYWHLNDVYVKVGDAVEFELNADGTPKYITTIGTIGKGGKTKKKPNGIFTAHLHFEFRRESLITAEWPSFTMSNTEAYEYISKTRFNSETLFACVHANETKPSTVVKVSSVKDIPALPTK